jgi:branched-chain amino acid transport system ATP-binding protein
MSKHPHLHDNEVILDVRDLRVAYGKVEALHGVDLCIRRGQIVTVIGPNGAGKTTLLAALIGLLPATGDIIYMGHPRRHER